jgi:hypothetical protein
MHSAFAGYAPRRDRLASACLAAAKEHLALPALTERRLTLVRPRSLPLIRNRAPRSPKATCPSGSH